MKHAPDVDPHAMTCHRMTGAYRPDPTGRMVWSGNEGQPQFQCGYQGARDQVLCHLIATHQLPLRAAQELVAAWVAK